MRFESFTIEKYGLVDCRTLSFPPDPGLVVIYGPNAAGKSTSLAAIADFLFGIPHNSPRGQVFGYDQIRLTAVVALAGGTRLSLRRRKGRVRTLTGESGQPSMRRSWPATSARPDANAFARFSDSITNLCAAAGSVCWRRTATSGG
jgi:AAA domain